MDHSPNYYNNKQKSFKSPLSTPPSTYGSPDFKPYNYSSPEMKGGYSNNRRGNARYFNVHHRNYTPNQHRMRGNFHNKTGGQRSFDPPDISMFVHQSMLEDPWNNLEKLLREKLEKGCKKIKDDILSSSTNSAILEDESTEKSDNFYDSQESLKIRDSTKEESPLKDQITNCDKTSPDRPD